ncbi:MAG: 16S rRNA (guanine(527)-N(7))-methyltransferase RsmG [Defluviitaleaceae bacterium]|nr:16S rRNA (guanine(527)-N(7))-methyltransferase RsmG [Defluviitaleaceae bacterium]
MHKNTIINWAKENAINITESQLSALESFQDRVLAVNKHMNLTAITTCEDFAVKHIIDSLTLLPYIPENANLIDIGTGAGFPGLVLRIMREDINLTLLDSLRKRVIFLRETSDMLNFPEVECIHARAEEFAKKHPEVFDICTARAVAKLDKLAKYTLPLIKKGGSFLAMKGPDTTAELAEAKSAIQKYGGSVEKIAITKIAEELNHSVIIIRK